MTGPDDGPPVDRGGLREILGYGAVATRIINLPVTAGISTPVRLREATYGDLVDIPGFGQRYLNHVVTSMAYYDSQTARNAGKEER